MFNFITNPDKQTGEKKIINCPNNVNNLINYVYYVTIIEEYGFKTIPFSKLEVAKAFKDNIAKSNEVKCGVQIYTIKYDGIYLNEIGDILLW